MEELFLPTLHTFENENIYTGSCGKLRFRIEPNIDKGDAKEVNRENSSMKAEYWHGDFCYEKSTMEGERVFPLSEEGKEQMRAWLLENA